MVMILRTKVMRLLSGGSFPPRAPARGAYLRDLWRNHPTVHGDHCTRRLAVKVLILEQMRAEVVTVCEQLHEMFTVASSDDLKQWAQTKVKVSCGEARQP